MENLTGTIYLNNGRWWWKVRLPGEQKLKYFPLKSTGAKFATKDRKTADIIAADIWQNHIKKNIACIWDGKLSTLAQIYNQHNIDYYLPPSREAYNISLAIMPLAEKYPDLQADEFTSLHLKEFLKFVVESDKYDWCRKLINERIRCIKRMFKWAASEMLISVHTFTALSTIEGLRKGRTIARESKKVLPANIELVNAVIDVVAPVIGDMIQIQILTAMRSGELCKMRPCNIDRSEEIWIYQPQAVDPTKQYNHKKDYLGYQKIITIGPKAKLLLAKYMFRDPTDYCFKPTESYRQCLQAKSDKRKTPLKYGNRPGTNCKGTMPLNECFNSDGYMKIIKRACKTAFPMPKELTQEEKKQWEKQHHWHPHQLRHVAGTEVTRKFGIDAARAVLGHQKINTTEYYVQLDLAKAKEVAKMMG